MKNYTNKYLLFSILWVWNLSNAGAYSNSTELPITQVLEQLSEKYQVFFTYDLELLQNISVEIEDFEGKELDEIIHQLLEPTTLRYERLSEKYYVIFSNNRSGKKTMRKMKRKIKQLQKLEKKSSINLHHNTKKTRRKIETILNSASEIENLKSNKIVNGKVIDEFGEALIGVNIAIAGTSIGTTTDEDGNFDLPILEGSFSFIVSYVGFKDQVIPINSFNFQTITLEEGLELGEVQVVGSRSYNRSAIDSPVAVDVIDISYLAEQNGKTEINQILEYAAPSFNATKQTGSDGADHIDPASLRGLGPDQTLILINGKRRHQSSLINIFGTRGRGNSGTDLNAIPVSAIKRIEILRDGASAQYGSDAIAGVINIVLKDQTDGMKGGVTYGMYSTAVGKGYDKKTDKELFNLNGEKRVLDPNGDKRFDGNTVKVDLNYGIKLGEQGGFMNITTEFLSKERTLRPSYSIRKGYGSASIEGFNTMINTAFPIGKNTEIYAFGGGNYRDTDAFAFSRGSFLIDGDNRAVPSLYPDGFSPHITSHIVDASISSGVRHNLKNEWTIDFNNTFGKNNFHYFIEGTNNASLWNASPTEFDAGGHRLSMNTTGLDFSKYYRDIAAGFNLAFGMEYRIENFQIFSGEEGSYALYDLNGIAITNPVFQSPAIDPNGNQLPGGSQGFPGYSPANEVNKNRTNLSIYLDSEVNLSKELLLAGALRFENYSDFGNTFNFKLATRYKLHKNLCIRASHSTGFRAPSLAQIHYNLLFNNIVSGTSVRTLLSSNTSTVTKAFGIGSLTEEKAFNSSFGFTFMSNGFTTTIDAYRIRVNDRIILTDNFDASMLGVGADNAQFFANGVDTKTTGVDIVLSYKYRLNESSKAMNFGVAANFNTLDIVDIKNGELNEFTFFGPYSHAFLKAAAPDYKVSFNLGYNTSKLTIMANYSLFSKIVLQDFQWVNNPVTTQEEADALTEIATDVYHATGTLNLNVSYKFTKYLNITLGSNNLLNTYPTPQFDGWTDQGGLNDSVQMGSDGAYFFARIGFLL